MSKQGGFSGGMSSRPVQDADMLLAREMRNVNRVYNPALNKGQRASLHGYKPAHKWWTSRMDEAMDEYVRTHWL